MKHPKIIVTKADVHFALKDLGRLFRGTPSPRHRSQRRRRTRCGRLIYQAALGDLAVGHSPA